MWCTSVSQNTNSRILRCFVGVPILSSSSALQQFSGMPATAESEKFSTYQSRCSTDTAEYQLQTRQTCTRTVLGAVLRLPCPQVHDNRPRSASNTRKHITCIEPVLLLSGGGISARRDSENGSIDFLSSYTGSWAQGALRLSKTLWSPSHRTPAACLTDNEEGRRWVWHWAEERHKLLREWGATWKTTITTRAKAKTFMSYTVIWGVSGTTSVSSVKVEHCSGFWESRVNLPCGLFVHLVHFGSAPLFILSSLSVTPGSEVCIY